MKLFLFIFLVLLLFPFSVCSAEVLQVTSSSVLQIGDNNRNYKIRIACINIDESKATVCSTEAEIASLVEADLRELFISEFNWAGNSTAFPLSK